MLFILKDVTEGLLNRITASFGLEERTRVLVALYPIIQEARNGSNNGP